MKYINPLIETLSVTYDDVTYTVDYYKPPITISGVVDETHSNWAVGTSYSAGAYCIVPELKKIFRAAIANSGVFPPSDPDTWTDYGPINSYKMLASDEAIGSKTSGGDGGYLEFDFSSCNALAGLDLDFIQANVMLINTLDIVYLGLYDAGTTYNIDERVFFANKLWKSLVGSNLNNTPDTSPSQWEEDTDNVSFNEPIYGSDIGCSDYGGYFYTGKTERTRKILSGLEWIPSSVLRIDFTGLWFLGTLCYNIIEDFGFTLVDSRVRYRSTSKFSENPITGYRTVLRFGKVRILDCKLVVDNELFGDTLQKGDELIDKNLVWIPTEEDNFAEAISVGYIEDLDVPMGNKRKFETKLKMVGVKK